MKRNRGIIVYAMAAVLVLVTVYGLTSTQNAVRVEYGSVRVNSEDRSYRLVVPDQQQDGPIPIVFAFHGIGDTVDSMADYSQLDCLAADNGFLLVYLAAHGPRWAGTDAVESNSEFNHDVRFFDQLLKNLGADYDIDGDRVYLVGMSNGATFVQLLAKVRSSVVAAVVAHSGARLPVPGHASHPFSILLIVGADDFVAGTVRSDLKYYRSAGHHSELILVSELGHEWSTQHNVQAWDFMVRNPLQRNDNVAGE